MVHASYKETDDQMRHRITFFAAAAIALAACSNDRCIIEGTISGLEGEGWVYIQDAWNGYETIDSTKAIDGVFRFESDIADPTHVYLYYNQEIQLHNMLLEPGTIKVSGDVEEAWALYGIGTPMNDRIAAFSEKTSSLDASKYSYDELKILIETLTLQELNEGDGDAYRLYLISNSYHVHPAHLLKSFETLDEELKSSGFAAETKDYLERMVRVYPQIEGSEVIPTFIDMEFPDLDGKNVSLSSVVNRKGNRYVLLDFWATWCEGCVEQMPLMKAAYEKYHDKGFEIYAVSCDPKPGNWMKFLAEEELAWVNVISGKTRNMPEWDIYALDGIPANILIDCKTGIIIDRLIPGSMLEERLSNLLD